MPGEVLMTHNGVFFLHELPEFKGNVLEVLRQPFEEGEVLISRATGSVTYPSNIMLVAAINPRPSETRVRVQSCRHQKTRRQNIRSIAQPHRPAYGKR